MLGAVSLLLILGCFVSACCCRARWADLSPGTRFILPVLAAGVAGLYAFMLCTGWISTSALINESIGALAVGGYSLLILLLTLFHPKILTRLVATVLLLPVLVAFVLLPLSAGSGGTIASEHVVGNLYFDRVPWDAGAMGSSGTTRLLYEKPRLLPFLKSLNTTYTGSFSTMRSACRTKHSSCCNRTAGTCSPAALGRNICTERAFTIF